MNNTKQTNAAIAFKAVEKLAVKASPLKPTAKTVTATRSTSKKAAQPTAQKTDVTVINKASRKKTVAAASKQLASSNDQALVNAAVKTEKQKKVKLIRDSFTAPKNELNVLSDLKLRALSLKVAVKKGELLRAGIKALAAMNDAAFLAAVGAVPALKTGRPKSK